MITDNFRAYIFNYDQRNFYRLGKDSFTADNVYTAARYGCLHATTTLLDMGITVERDKLLQNAIASGSRWLCATLISRGYGVSASMCNDRVEDGYVGLHDVFYNLDIRPPKQSDEHDELLVRLVSRYISGCDSDKPERLNVILKVIDGYDVTAGISYAANMCNYEMYDILRKHGSYDMCRRREEEGNDIWDCWKNCIEY